MIQVSTQPYRLPLKHVFTIARGSTTVRDTLIVSLSADGQTGYGEATSNSYYKATIPELVADIQRVTPLLEAFDTAAPDELVGQLIPQLAEQLVGKPFALCALDMALHDLWGKLRGQPVWRLWGLNPANAPTSNYTIGIDTIPKMVEKAQEVADWPLLKIKLGTKEDLAIVRELRQHTEAIFRVDANCGWTAEQTIEFAPELKDLGVEFIEQPLPAEDRDGARKVFEQCALPVIADESCIGEDDVARCEGHFHGINIKLVKCGGLAPARRMVQTARRLGLKVMAGCMTESTVGISALGQLAPLLDFVDMDGAALLADDLADGVKVVSGRAQYPDRPGSGIEMDEHASALAAN
ncbi:L-Ala-D/L-Glu epimerase [Botrimarina colliarenosi]|uniref:Dipeptide epimerase n=1 Tax=Botrimarina colliarenosi TaxID=2528001 RepID=A0A5C6A2E7_9BACT|nr:dipeptide epimerase [Botrimarina colliarenosi]TWT93467.1 L-Ala-D/L-Glu epimerase [Botrimarina colliarenosi]